MENLPTFRYPKLIYEYLPTSLVVLFTTVFYWLIIFGSQTEITYDRFYFFFTSVFSLFLLTLYSKHISDPLKRGRLADILLFVFAVISVYLIIQFAKNPADISFLSLLVFTQAETSRLLRRTINGGFPLFTFAFNLLVLYLSLNRLDLRLVPLLYLLFQVIEEILQLKYEKFKGFFEESVGDLAYLALFATLLAAFSANPLIVLFVFITFMSLWLLMARDALKQR
ncbi:MAG: hypothetical protein Q8N84_01340 [bacterium]|nr:hypothetical protein [bacterium]